MDKSIVNVDGRIAIRDGPSAVGRATQTGEPVADPESGYNQLDRPTSSYRFYR